MVRYDVIDQHCVVDHWFLPFAWLKFLFAEQPHRGTCHSRVDCARYCGRLQFWRVEMNWNFPHSFGRCFAAQSPCFPRHFCNVICWSGWGGGRGGDSPSIYQQLRRCVLVWGWLMDCRLSTMAPPQGILGRRFLVSRPIPHRHPPPLQALIKATSYSYKSFHWCLFHGYR